MRDFQPTYPLGANLSFARGVQLLDDCEGTFTWLVAGTGGDDVHEYATAAAYMGNKGMRLKNRTTGAAASDSLVASKDFGYPESGYLAVRAQLCALGGTTISQMSLELLIHDGAAGYIGRLLYQPNVPAMWYIDASGNPVAIAAMALPVYQFGFVHWDLSIDCRAFRYLSAGFHGIRADLSGIGLYSLGALTTRLAAVQITVVAAGAAAAEIYADNIYVGEIPPS